MFSNLLHLGLLVLLVFKLNLGVAGAGLATSLSHWVAITFLMTRVLSRGYMRWVGGWVGGPVGRWVGRWKSGWRPAGWVGVHRVWLVGLMASRRSVRGLAVPPRPTLCRACAVWWLPPYAALSPRSASTRAIPMSSPPAPPPAPGSVADLARPPAWSEVAPMLRQGLFLSTRSLLAMGG